MSMTDDQLKKLRKDMETADPVEEEVDEDGRPSKCSASKEKTIRFAEDSLPL